ncbi:U3 small nucleolar RNA-associated protein MPP10 [Zancudomyces culisetae]|uniref:U3 small nucleolar RNA-associated protein MPP10 n=1 Tax=Zancudomyces culisetae TaxID=1213189 RepID=A0A1R1PVM0_ZANCU|nr:U3 small nucleolar RNA-associated protein MPP10 [Zancudomyces culisetae]OMH84991.1 U3 small nucleolar RNA-associated protein MPP10 [Zancudomyces culisetae]|eukprot:OMH78575.1 U3 small nucleolar RNA-associated protein MPP10 [Zancudomyces culisetae]
MDDEELDSETFSDLDGEGEYETSATNKRKNKSGESETKRSVVDDDFFSLDQMHKFTEQAEMLEEKRLGMLNDDENQEDEEENEDEDEGESEIDYFEDDAGDDDGFDASKIKYGDFFKPPTLAGSSKGVVRSTTESKKRKAESVEKTVEEEEEEEEKEEGGEQSNMSDDEGKGKEDEDGNDIEEYKRKRVRFEQNDEGEDDEEEEDSKNDDRNKSEFEKYTDQMGKRIKTLEQQLVAKKDWTMIGEVNSKMRPVNSLLEEHLEYDYVQKPVPVITQTVTEALEDMIKNRIVEQQFDDVERKKATQQTERSSSNKEDFELLDENKPKQSLAQVYEEEYKQQQQQKSGTKAAHKDAALHAEIEALYSKLAYTLDSLSNFQYTPKMVSPNTTDPSIRPDQPAIEMEEALPILVSEANRMAPKEVYSGIKGIKKTDDISSDGKSAPTAPVIPSNNVIHGKGTGILISSTEASKADRRRWRAAKKKAKAAANADKKPKSKPEPESKPKPKSQ